MSFDWSIILRSEFITFLAQGAVVTLYVSLIAEGFSILLGLGLAYARIMGSNLPSSIASSYIWLFRGTPLLVQLIIIYSGLPQLGIRFSEIESAILGLSLHGAAYTAEIFRGSVAGIDTSQIEAARIDGATDLQAFFL